MRSRGYLSLTACAFVALAVVACGGEAEGPSAPVSIGGTVSGLSGAGLELADNGDDHLSVSSNGPFTFATKVAPGYVFSVSVLTQPTNPSQTCLVTRGSGAASTSGAIGLAVTCTTDAPTLSLFAGSMGGAGSNDGSGAGARFTATGALSLDAAGNVYVADLAVRKITPFGVVTTIGQLTQPQALATDRAGNVYVTGADGQGPIRKMTPDGVVTTFATLEASGAQSAWAMAFDASGNIYAADFYDATILKISPAGVVKIFAGANYGYTGGPNIAPVFLQPLGIATDTEGNVYVADSGHNTIRKITPAGVVSALAGDPYPGSADGVGESARFDLPTGIAVDAAGNVYVADTSNSLIRKITPGGVVTTFAGTAGAPGYADGIGAAAKFSGPNGLTIDPEGNLYVGDSGNSVIRKISPLGEVTTIAGQAAVLGIADGTGAAAQFSNPQGITADAAGNLYVADYWNDEIRKITPAAVVTALAGGVKRTPFHSPMAVAIDESSNVFALDIGDDTIQKVSPAGVVTTLASMGTFSNVFPPIVSMGIDPAGNLYFPIMFYTPYNCGIQQVTPSGAVNWLFGAGDQPQDCANLRNPQGVATDRAGNIYVADTWNQAIRKFTPAGVETTLAGGVPGVGQLDGVGAAAQFEWPTAITTDAAANVYVVDNNTIRKVTQAGVVTTVVGKADVGGFAAGPLPGVIGTASGITISGTSLYITTNQGVAVVTNVP